MPASAAVRVARRFFHLPYFDAKFQIGHKSEGVEYSAVRTHRAAPKATFAANYRPIGPVYHSAPGSLDSWLTDRYCLSAVDDAGNLYRGEIDHDRWPLQPAAGEVRVNTLGNLGRLVGNRDQGPARHAAFCKVAGGAGVVGGADVSLQYPGASGIGKVPKKFRGGQRRFGHAPAGAGTSTKAPSVGIHSVNGGVTYRSDCWMDGDLVSGMRMRLLAKRAISERRRTAVGTHNIA
jgi:hypothetical protein